MASEIRTLKDKDIQVLPRTRADAVSTTDGSTVQDKINNIPTDSEKQTWNNKSDFDGDYNSLTNKPNIPIVSTSVSSESTTIAASSSAVKEAYDLANWTWEVVEQVKPLVDELVNSMPYMSKDGGTFNGSVYAGSGHQDYDVSLLRNSKLVSSETTPTYNGEIYWVYG